MEEGRFQGMSKDEKFMNKFASVRINESLISLLPVSRRINYNKILAVKIHSIRTCSCIKLHCLTQYFSKRLPFCSCTHFENNEVINFQCQDELKTRQKNSSIKTNCELSNQFWIIPRVVSYRRDTERTKGRTKQSSQWQNCTVEFLQQDHQNLYLQQKTSLSLR